jgi:hypothetical protein
VKLVKEYYSYSEGCSETNSVSVINLIETMPSCLRDVSWMCEFIPVRVSVLLQQNL